ncbi:MAG: hypothetical protein J6P98_02885, partial [Clostridia bacterium]|nr:hypothetical protein [Clostridia bacterium]
MFSLITYADGTPWLIDRTVLSVMASRFESYELLIGEKECGDAGERYSSLSRVRVVTAEWSIAPLKAAESASSGDVIIRLEPGDVLRRGALSEFCAAFERDPLLEAVYSDSDMLYDGRRDSPRMRAERGLLTLLCCEPLLRPLAVRRRLHFAAGGFLGGNNEGLASYAFRCLSMAAEVRHIDRALLSSSRRDIAEAKPFAVSRKVCVYEGKTEGLLRPVWERGRRPRACVVTYAPDEQYRLKRLLECMEDIAAYPRLETVIAAGSGLDDRYEKYLAALEKNGAAKLVRVKENRPYVPRLLNAAARKTGAEFLIFLSPALIPVTPELVEELITPLLLPGLGICGGKVKNATGR